MKFTFDDIQKPMPSSVAAEIERLKARMGQLRSNPKASSEIATLERRRQQLLTRYGRGLKPPTLPRAVDDGR